MLSLVLRAESSCDEQKCEMCLALARIRAGVTTDNSDTSDSTATIIILTSIKQSNIGEAGGHTDQTVSLSSELINQTQTTQ